MKQNRNPKCNKTVVSWIKTRIYPYILVLIKVELNFSGLTKQFVFCTMPNRVNMELYSFFYMCWKWSSPSTLMLFNFVRQFSWHIVEGHLVPFVFFPSHKYLCTNVLITVTEQAYIVKQTALFDLAVFSYIIVLPEGKLLISSNWKDLNLPDWKAKLSPLMENWKQKLMCST